MKKIVILGGGISGLTVAYELSPHYSVTLVEKKKSAGGWIETDDKGPYFFEKGPRTFPVRRSKELIELALQLGLERELLPMSRRAKKRFLWIGGRLRSFPMNPFSLAFHLLFKEWRIPPLVDDETIWEFAVRRFGERTADLLFDPLVKGIFGGDVKKLSVRASLPFLKECERKHGSILKGIFKKKGQKWQAPRVLDGSSLFAFRSGMQSLVDALEKQIRGEIFHEEEVKELRVKREGWEVVTNRRTLFADILISALPAFVLTTLFDREFSEELCSIPYAGLTLVHLGFEGKVLSREGFGYLIPTVEGEKVLGVLFDSSLFPEQNKREKETRLTVVLPLGGKVKEALQAISSQLKIKEKPSFVGISSAPQAIPQYLLGHRERLVHIERRLQENFPPFFLVGSYLDGVSVNACIKRSKECAEKITDPNDDPPQ